MALNGFALPAIRSSGGYFTSRRDIDCAWGDLLIAIMTPIGGRFMNRSFGSGLSTVLFDPSDNVVIGMVSQYINDAAVKHCPYVKIRNIDVSLDKKKINVKVTFSLAGVQADKLMTLDRSNTVNYLSMRSR
jgi:phage baseplate assembly protein W